MEGSATAHPMLIGRERHLPGMCARMCAPSVVVSIRNAQLLSLSSVICGVPGLMSIMKRFDGQTVTMDGLTKKIYLGDQALRAAKQEEIGIM